jgi:hypothetical protein
MPGRLPQSSASWRRLSRLAALATLVMALAWPRPAAACSCAQPGSPSVAFAQMPAVFTGTVAHIGGASGSGLVRLLEPLRQWLGLAPVPNAYAVLATVDVHSAWKGVTTTPVAVLTDASSASCGYAFSAGQQYLIYAFADGSSYSTNLCTRTVELAQAAADLAYLQTVPTLAVSPAPGASLLPAFCLGLAALLASSALLIPWALRRRAAAQR